MTAALSPPPKMQFFDSNGDPLVNAKLYTYAAGTDTPLATYTDSTGNTANANPVRTDARGECNLWLSGAAYKLVLYTSADALIWSVDNVTTVPVDVPGANVTFTQGGTGAITGTMQNKARLEVSNIDFIPLANRALVLARTSTVNLTASIQAALDYLGENGGGTLILDGRTTIRPSVAANNILNVSSNTTIRGRTPADGLKIANDCGNYRCVFGPAEACNNVRFENFTLDQNASGNTTSTILPGTAAALSGILFSDYAVDGLTVDGVIFKEAPGVNTICVSTDATGTVATNIAVRNIQHEFLQGAYSPTILLDYYDNSSVYIIGVGITCSNNHYKNMGALGDAVTAEELHGREIVSWGSEVISYQYHAILVSELTVTGLANNIVYGGYVSEYCRSGPVLYSTTAGGLNGVNVGPGVTYLGATTDFPVMTDPSIGIGLWYDAVSGTVDGFLKNIKFHDLIIISPQGEDADLSDASSHVYLEANGLFEGVEVTNVRSVNAPNMGVNVYSHSATAQKNVVIKDFRATDPGNNSLSALRFGVIWRGVAGEGCELVGTRITDTGSPLNGPAAIDLQFLAANTNLLATDNLSFSTAGITPPSITGSQYAHPLKFRTITVAATVYTILTRDGTQLFTLDVAVGTAVSIVGDAILGRAPGDTIRIYITNSSGGATSVTWGADFEVVWTDLTAGQAIWYEFRLVGTKWVQSAAAVAVTP
jgi:hypothetical protein